MGSPGISRDRQSYFGVLGYSAMESHFVDGKSQDFLRVSELLWCTEILCHRGWLGGWQVMGYPGTVRVTLVYRDTLLQRVTGWMTSLGVSWDCQGVLRYSATEGGWVDGKSRDILALSELPGYSGGWVDGKSRGIP